MSDESTPLVTHHSERSMVRAWQRGLGGPLRTTGGHALTVVYRGRCPGGAGPDVRGALLAFGGGQLVEGDVEFHLLASDWIGHGHHADPHFRSVVLHVVLDDDAAPSRDSAGQAVPTLVLALAEVARLTDGGAAVSPDAAACHRAARDRGPVELG